MHYFFYKVRWYIGIALLLCLAISVMKYSAWIDRTLFSKQPRNVSQQPLQTGSQAMPVNPYNASGLVTTVPSTPADVLVQFAQAKSLLDEASANASEALKNVLTWQSDVEPMRDQVLANSTAAPTDDASGQSLGGDTDTELFDRLAYVLRRGRTSAQELRDVVIRINSLQTKLDGLTAQSRPVALSPIEMADISQLHATCKQAKENWRRDVEQALAIKHLIDTRSKVVADPVAPTTIGSKLKDADANAALANLNEQIVREAEEKAAERKREADLAEQRRLKEEREAELLAKATSPEVKALLAPFFEPRTIQPSLSGTFSIKWVRTFDKKPMSLGKLINIGALDDSVLGLKKLALVVGNRKLPEPKWSIASQPNNWSSDDESRLKQAQQMLRDYGPILIKARLLSE